MITLALGKSLLEIADEKGDQKMKKALWNTYYCQTYLTSSGGRSFGNYCKNRFCLVCCGNRKAELISKYYPVISKWDKPQFVTLTVKAVRAKSLSKWMAGVIRAFDLIHGKLKKQEQRGKGIRLVGIRSLECNFNPEKRTYNPHLHLIVQNEEMAQTLVNEWLLKWTSKFTTPKAQKIIPISDTEEALIEIIKYGTKIFTEPDPTNKKGKGQRAIYTKALYNILNAMKGKRLFERFGFNLKSFTLKSSIIVIESERWSYSLGAKDWINKSETKLSNYLPNEQLLELLDKINQRE